MKKISLVLLFFISFNIFAIKVDSGSSGIEFNLGNVYLLRKKKEFIDPISRERILIKQNLSFWYIAHNYVSYSGDFFNFFFNSHLGINKNLILQNGTDFSYKNLFAGIIVGGKYKYLKGFWLFIPEFSFGGVVNIISDWANEGVISQHYLSFFTGAHIGAGIWIDSWRKLGLIGFKADFNIGYNNYMNTDRDREIAYILSLYLSFDFYDD